MTVGEKSVIPDNVTVGKNSVISGIMSASDFDNAFLASGKTMIKAGDDL